MEFLRESNAGKRQALGTKIAVVGGGNVAVDVARICLNSVYTQPYRVTRAEDYLKGKLIDETTTEAEANQITEDALALLNNRYKIQIARALIKRVILACVWQ